MIFQLFGMNESGKKLKGKIVYLVNDMNIPTLKQNIIYLLYMYIGGISLKKITVSTK